MSKKENKGLATVDIKGNPYVLVCTRVVEFHKRYPKGSISTKIEEIDDSRVLMTAEVRPNGVDRVFTGHAEETRSGSYINKTTAVENCETSAIGRALGLLGIGTEESMASADEVANAISQQSESKILKAIFPLSNSMFRMLSEAHFWIRDAIIKEVIPADKYIRNATEKGLNDDMIDRVTEAFLRKALNYFFNSTSVKEAEERYQKTANSFTKLVDQLSKINASEKKSEKIPKAKGE